jgi:hypothetical protein
MSRRCLCKPPRAEAAPSSSVAEKPRRPGLPSRRSGRRASARPRVTEAGEQPRALPRPGSELPGAGKQPRRLLPGRASHAGKASRRGPCRGRAASCRARAEPRRPRRAAAGPAEAAPPVAGRGGGAAQAKASRRGPCRGRAACCRARASSRAACCRGGRAAQARARRRGPCRGRAACCRGGPRAQGRARAGPHSWKTTRRRARALTDVVVGRSCGCRPRPRSTWPWGKVVRKPTDHSVAAWAQERRR